MQVLKFLCITLLLVCSYALANGYALRTVQAGESLGLIANSYNISVEELMAFNALSSATIHPGDVLKIPYIEATGGLDEVAPTPPPGFRTHILVEGQTLSDLMNAYSLSLESIVGANPDISSLDNLPAGTEVLIPPAQGLVITLSDPKVLMELMVAYDLDPVRIAQANNINAPEDISAGKMLFLPGVLPVESLERLKQVRAMENRYVWPVHGRITSYFGRRNLGLGTAGFHRAIDVAAPSGTPLVAARSGVVTYAGWSERGYGNLVKISHYGGAETWYAHLSEVSVTLGQQVEQNEVIGLIGSTGLSTGPHVHFELHEQGVAIDPLTHLH